MKLVIDKKEEIIPLRELIKKYFIKCYKLCSENKTEMSDKLELDRHTVRKYCKMYNLDTEQKVNQFKVKTDSTEEKDKPDKQNYPHYYECITPVTPEERDHWYNLDSY